MKAIVVSLWYADGSRSKYVTLCEDSKADEKVREVRNQGTEIEDIEILPVY